MLGVPGCRWCKAVADSIFNHDIYNVADGFVPQLGVKSRFNAHSDHKP